MPAQSLNAYRTPGAGGGAFHWTCTLVPAANHGPGGVKVIVPTVVVASRRYSVVYCAIRVTSVAPTVRLREGFVFPSDHWLNARRSQAETGSEIGATTVWDAPVCHNCATGTFVGVASIASWPWRGLRSKM